MADYTISARDLVVEDYDAATGYWTKVSFVLKALHNATGEMNHETDGLTLSFQDDAGHGDDIICRDFVDGIENRIELTGHFVPSSTHVAYSMWTKSGMTRTFSPVIKIQLPGKPWDFNNDTVADDMTLVSHWDNYGYMTDTNNVKHGLTSMEEAKSLITGYYGTNPGKILVDGVVYDKRTDIKGIKLSHMVEGDTAYLRSGNRMSAGSFNALTDLDIVSSKATELPDDFLNGSSTIFNKRFDFPNTLTKTPFGLLSGVSNFRQDIWIPDSVKYISGMLNSSNNYYGTIRFPKGNDTDFEIGNGVANLASGSSKKFDVVMPEKASKIGTGFFNNSPISSKTDVIAFPDGITTIENQNALSWYYSNSTEYPSNNRMTIVVPDGVVEIKDECFHAIGNCKEIVLPSTLRKIGNNCFYNLPSPYNQYHVAGKNVSINFPDSLEEVGNGFLYGIYYSYNGTTVAGEIHLPNKIKKIGNNCLGHCRDIFNHTKCILSGWGYNSSSSNRILYVPEGCTTIGNNFLYDIDPRGDAFTVKLPSTLTSIGVGFFGDMYYTGTYNIDLSLINPSIWPDNDTTSFTADTLQRPLVSFTVKIASGTLSAWQAKLPDLEFSTPVSGRKLRSITWQEV